MTSKVYDALKFFALVMLPGLGALYFGLGQLWDFPEVEKVVGSIGVVDTFLGLLINKLSKDNIVGSLIVAQDEEGVPQGMRLEADKDLLVFRDQSQIAFRVKREMQV